MELTKELLVDKLSKAINNVSHNFEHDVNKKEAVELIGITIASEFYKLLLEEGNK